MNPHRPAAADCSRRRRIGRHRASVGYHETRREHAQKPLASRARIDAVLKQAVDTRGFPRRRDVRSDRQGSLYEGAFGVRELARGTT